MPGGHTSQWFAIDPPLRFTQGEGEDEWTTNNPDGTCPSKIGMLIIESMVLKVHNEPSPSPIYLI